MVPVEEWPILYVMETKLFGILREFHPYINKMPKEILKGKLLCLFVSMNKDLSVNMEKLSHFLDDNIDAIYTFVQHLKPFNDNHQEDIFWRDTLNVDVFLQCVRKSKEFSTSVRDHARYYSAKHS